MPAQAISTNFDKPIEEDVLLESIDGNPPLVKTTLQNAENVYKSFLYLRKMYSMFPAKRTVLGMGTIIDAVYVPVAIPDGSNFVTLNNFGGTTSGVKLNGNEYIMSAGEKIELPVVSADSTATPAVVADTLELRDNVSYILENRQEL